MHLNSILKGASLGCFVFLLLVSSHPAFCEVEPNNSGFHWIPNNGQWPEEVKYRAELPAGRLFLEKNGLTYAFLDRQLLEKFHKNKFYEGSIDAHAVRMRFLEANPNPRIDGSQPTSFYYNFFLGNNSKDWSTKVKGQKQVQYKNLYDGIDWRIFSKDGHLKHNFYVKPSGEASSIEIKYEGAEATFIEDGHLYIKTSVNKFRELAPVAYQKNNGEQVEVPCEFQLVEGEKNAVKFHLPEGYDTDNLLVIDPKVIFSTYSGSPADNFGYTATFDSLGHGYSGGTVFGPKFPTTTGAYQENWGGGEGNTQGISAGGARDIGIIKYNDSGTNVKYITYLGGAHNEDPHSLVVNNDGDLLVFGNSGSSNFPMVGNPYKDSLDGDYDMIVAKLSASGDSLKGSTFLGGSDKDGLNGAQVYIRGEGYTNSSPVGFNYGDIFRGEVIVNEANEVWIASVTSSSDFPVTQNVVQPVFGGGDQDACVTKLSADLSTLEYSSFIGGTADDAGYSVALSDQGGVYIAGGSASQQFPFNFSGHQTTNQGGPADGFAIHLSKDLTTTLGASLLGTSGYDQIYFLQTGPNDDVYVTGQTNSDQFPNFNTDYNSSNGKQFIAKFNPSLDSLFWSGKFGSGKRKSPDLSPSAFLVDECGRIFFSGWGGNTNFQGKTDGLEVTSNAFQKSTDGSDFYLALFARDMQKLLYGSYYGGQISHDHVDGGTSRFDENGIVYQSVCAGCGGYSDLPTTPNAWSSKNRGIRPWGDSTGCNNALLKIDLKAQDLFSGFEAPNNACLSDTVEFQNTSQLADSYYWFFGDGDSSSLENPAHQYAEPGTYQVKMVAENLNSCTVTDTVTDSITIYDHLDAQFSSDTSQCTNSIQFEYENNFGNRWHWEFGDSSVGNVENPVHTYQDSGAYEVTLIVDSGTSCADTTSDSVFIDNTPEPQFSFTIDTCEGRLNLDNQSRFADTFLWLFQDSVERPQGDTGQLTHYYDEVGDLTATLISQPGSYCADSLTKNFRLEIPDINFSPEIIDTCNFEYAFVDESRFSNKGHWSFENGDSFDVKGDTLLYQFPEPGQYEIKMVANGPRGICIDSLTKTIEVDSLPDADFQYSMTPCASFVNVHNDSRHANHYLWRIKAMNHSYDTTYFNPDTNRLFLPYSKESYEIVLVANPNSDCADTSTNQLNLDSAAHAEFETNLDTCRKAVEFSNYSTRNGSYEWSFGNGSTTNQKSPIHLYEEPGDYEVRLIMGDQGCSDTTKKEIGIPEVPQAEFSLKREQCSSKLKMENLSKYANRSFKWEIGADTVIFANISDYRVRDTGAYPITLVADPFGKCPDTNQKKVQIDAFADARFDFELDSCTGKTEFEPELDSFGQYQWDFGNGESSKAYNPVITYDISGVYEASLVNTFENCSDTFNNDLTIRNPEAKFSINRKYCSPEVKFQNLSRGEDQHKWLFGDGTESSEPNPRKIYKDTGKYQVRLIADPNSVCADTFAVDMDITEFVWADFEVNKDPCGTEVTLYNQSERADSIRWSLGFKGKYEKHKDTLTDISFPEIGKYQMKIVATNENCRDSLVKIIRVDSPPKAGFKLSKIPCTPRISLEDRSSNAKNVTWLFGDGNQSSGNGTITHEYEEAGLFTISQVVNPKSKCTDTVRKQAEISLNDIREVKVPNVFTPNGDGMNDNFVVQGLDGCDGYQITIYNRWGSVVFKDSGEVLKWNGKDGKTDQTLNSGTYYYELKNGSFKQEGTISLIR